MADQQIVLNINLDGVAVPATSAAAVCKEIVDLYFAALDKTDLSKKPEDQSDGKSMKVGFSGLDLTANERRAVHQSWILARAFQDLMRGVRRSLEEAYFVLELTRVGKVRAATDGTLDDVLRPFRKAANDLNFPNLLAAVNAHLDPHFEFTDAYQSMQTARNCLEHRNGIVGKTDAGDDGKLVLQFPRIKVYVERDGGEVEIFPGMHVEAGTIIMVKTELRRREYTIGQPLIISAVDFDEIAIACSQFGAALAQKLSVKLAPK
ncbi:hypothetical protein QY049_03315 [Bradyrhizobium sp. WYCCWR 13022]|uniref:hypothetical protein n=1 Tax=unclassified Bradyrhizobium TaxID=2631580 RepID=UPI00263B44E9|nr:hypothetical protein [Bradyrhizobium sp. WYCCWR 13022]MDN4982255.1 hypothetical protein [Bradyrhizobium sp. WYCCWR 13022]